MLASCLLLVPAALAPCPGALPSLHAAAPRAAQQQSGAWHVDPRFGFKLKPPREWLAIPIQADEGWLIAKFLSKRSYFYTDRTEGWTWEHKPELMVIAFVDEKLKERETKIESEDGGATITWNNRFKDYKDYLRQTYSGGGYYVSAEEEREVDGVRVTELQIKVERMTRTGPKRIVTWIFHVPDVDIAVQFEVLEERYDELESLLERTLQSFQAIERTEPLPRTQGSPTGWVVFSSSAMDKLSPLERRQRRIQATEATHERAIANLTEGWTHLQMGHFLVLTNADEKYAERLVDQASLVLDWLERSFPYVGPEEYVRRPILRICKTQEEELSYTRGGGAGWAGMGLEMITNQETGGSLSYEYEWINRRLMEHWFQDRDRELFWAMPEWIDYGLRQLVSQSRAKGRNLTFYVDGYNRDELRALARQGQTTPPRELMRLAREDFYADRGPATVARLRQVEALVYFLVAGDGARKKEYREIVPDYLRNLKLALLEAEGPETGESKPEAAPQTEEEEERRLRERREELRKKEKVLLDDVFERTFRSWSERDWERFDKAFAKAIG